MLCYDTTSELSRFLNFTKAPEGSWLMDEVSFRGVKLCYVQQSVATAFEAERGKYSTLTASHNACRGVR